MNNICGFLHERDIGAVKSKNQEATIAFHVGVFRVRGIQGVCKTGNFQQHLIDGSAMERTERGEDKGINVTIRALFVVEVFGLLGVGAVFERVRLGESSFAQWVRDGDVKSQHGGAVGKLEFGGGARRLCRGSQGSCLEGCPQQEGEGCCGRRESRFFFLFFFVCLLVCFFSF